jgi:hypothetical protein
MAGKEVLVLVWDNASWRVSKEVHRWIGEHNRGAKRAPPARIGQVTSRSRPVSTS